MSLPVTHLLFSFLYSWMLFVHDISFPSAFFISHGNSPIRHITAAVSTSPCLPIFKHLDFSQVNNTAIILGFLFLVILEISFASWIGSLSWTMPFMGRGMNIHHQWLALKSPSMCLLWSWGLLWVGCGLACTSHFPLTSPSMLGYLGAPKAPPLPSLMQFCGSLPAVTWPRGHTRESVTTLDK